MCAALTVARGARALRPLAPALARPLSTKPKGSAHPYESFLSGNASNYVEDMYEAWKEDPSSVHASWRSVFESADAGAPPGATFAPPPTINAGQSLVAAAEARGDPKWSPAASSGSALRRRATGGMEVEATDALKVMQLIHAYQARGHNIADLDPLGIYDADLDGSIPQDLDPATYGFSEADLEREFDITAVGASGFMGADTGKMKLRAIIDRLNQIYASHIGVEFMHIWHDDQVNWLREQMETIDQFEFSREERLRLLHRLAWSDHFESFLASKHPTRSARRARTPATPRHSHVARGECAARARI